MSNILKKISSVSNKIRIGIINGVFWLIVLLCIYILTSGSEDVIKGRTLYLQFSGNVIESPGEEDLLTIITSDNFEVPQNTLLRNLLEVIDLASNDKNIDDMILDLDYLAYLGLGSAEEIGNALNSFRENGKEIYAFSSFYNRGQYYLASFATEVSMDPFGEINIDGLSVYRNYWKGVLDTYDVDVQIFRAGEYKSYVEPYISSSMSEAVKKQNLNWMNSIWDKYIENITINRDFSSDKLDSYFTDRLAMLKKYGGDSSLLAFDEGFVNHIETKNEFFNKFSELYYYTDYLAENSQHSGNSSNSNIAVVTLEGAITYSDNSSGSISAVDVELLLDRVLTDEMDGLIVRINSGGGGVFASELIRRKVSEISSNIPVVISMGDVCASGGYWIATAGDKIFANNSTITGSIGVFGMLFGLEKTLANNLGIYSDGVSTTPGIEPVSLTKNINPESGAIIQLSVENTYKKFLDLVADSRHMDLDYLSGLAEGRVWSGIQGLENGLVDSIGGLDKAADYFGDDVNLVYMDKELPLVEQILTAFSGIVKIPEIKVLEELSLFEKIDDPKSIYALWY